MPNIRATVELAELSGKQTQLPKTIQGRKKVVSSRK
jgi:hypothetical protein